MNRSRATALSWRRVARKKAVCCCRNPKGALKPHEQLTISGAQTILRPTKRNLAQILDAQETIGGGATH